jgi:hypothetical protein
VILLIDQLLLNTTNEFVGIKKMKIPKKYQLFGLLMPLKRVITEKLKNSLSPVILIIKLMDGSGSVLVTTDLVKNAKQR